MQRGLALWSMMLVFGVGAVAAACGGSTPEADAPAAPAGEEGAAAPAEGPPPGDTGHDLDVGMHFEGDEDEEEPVREHEPPPTSTWKPTEKERLKPDEEKKE